MTSLRDKKIVLGVSGSIAAYKTPQLVRLMVKAGADVQVVLTEHASDFVTPLTLAAVSQHAVADALTENNQWNNHVLLGRSADLMLIAPCSANTLAKLAHGLCDNLLSAVYLSTKASVLIAPAMDEDMWLHPVTQANVKKLSHFGNEILPVGTGDLASGLSGKGRMLEPEQILGYVERFFQNSGGEELPDKAVSSRSGRALVTAGPTFEAIDPVRYIGNYSTGKMGNAIAIALAEQGFEVDLVIGPGVPEIDYPSIKIHPIVSAEEMYQACIKLFPNSKIAVMAAAVADFRPKQIARQKIKKAGRPEEFDLKMVRNPDILKQLGSMKKQGQTLVGFALETENELENGLKKVKAKNADYIILNSLRDEGAGFGTDTNKVIILRRDGHKIPLPLQSKQKIADAIVSEILK